MKKSLILSLALLGVVAAGCKQEPAEPVDTTIVEPAAPVTEPTDDLMMDDTTGMMVDTTGSMEGTMMADTTTTM